MAEKRIDVNVSLGRWPFQKFAVESADALAAHLQRERIAEAWVSAVESILFPDPDVYDERLFDELQAFDALHPVKTINPALATWRDSLKMAVEDWGARAVKLIPNYHGYELTDYRAAEFMREVVQYDVPVFVQLRVEDERNQYPRMKVPGVPAGALAMLANYNPQVRIIALCAFRGELGALAAADNIYTDLSFVEHWDTGAALIKAFDPQRILFGSHTPFLYTRAARMKIDYGTMSDAHRNAIAGQNAQTLMQAHPPAERLV